MLNDVLNLETSIAPYIPSEFPRIYRENYPLFIAFMQSYYQWIAQEGNPDYKAKTLLQNRDIDTTLPQYLSHFEYKYLNGIPFGSYSDADIRMLVKNIKYIINLKGSAEGIKFIFESLYGEVASVYRPGNDLLRPSDGIWHQDSYLEVSYSPVLKQAEGKVVTGINSKATAYVYRYEFSMLSKSKSVYLLYVSDVVGTFLPNEPLQFSGVSLSLQNTPFIRGSLGAITIYQGGLNFSIGDNLTVFLDPTETRPATNAVAVVSSTIPRNGVVQFNIVDGGAGYSNSTTDANGFCNQTVIITQSNTNPGAGASFQVGELSNTFVVTCSNDFINAYSTTLLSANAYGFPSDPSANAATVLENALNIQTIEVGTIKTLAAVNPGAGYTAPVTVSVLNPVIASLNILSTNGSIDGTNADITGFASMGEGSVYTVKVKQSGFGYVDGEHLGLSSSNNSGEYANGIAVISGLGIGEGSWKNTRGFLDYDKYIQDSYYYQSFSYEIRSALSPDIYELPIKSNWHVAGTEMFGRVVSTLSTSLDLTSSLEIG